MKRTSKSTAGILLTIILFVTILIVSPALSQGRSVKSVEGAKFDVATTIKDNLKLYASKDVIIHLRSGKNLQGYVKSIGDHLVHIEKMSGKDFYDALIRIEDITAMEAKFREMK